MYEYTRWLAVQLQPSNVSVNCVAPGGTVTNRFVVIHNIDEGKLIEEGTLDRSGRPHEIASVVAFLASEEGRFISGQVIRKPKTEMSEPLVFLNNHMVPASQAHIAIYDTGIVLGATVTEQTRTFHKRLWRLDAHLDRLFRSLRYTRMDIGLTKEQLAGISHELIDHNARLLDDGNELGLIHFVTAGEHSAYAGSVGRPARTTPTVCVHTFPLPFELWAKKMLSGAHLITPSIRHVPPQCYDPKVKYRSRMHFYLADLEARRIDPEASALLLDLAGNLTETSSANFLIVERGTIVSPTTVNTLPGISRALVIELAGKLGVPFVERDLQVYNVMNAEEAFLASTPFCLMPVTRINDARIGDGKPGAMTRRLLSVWSAEVGLDIEKQIQSRFDKSETRNPKSE